MSRRQRWAPVLAGAAVSALALAGCSGGQAETDSDAAEEADAAEAPETSDAAADSGELEVEEQAYTVLGSAEIADQLYVSVTYAAVLRNSSETDWVDATEVRIAFLDDDDEEIVTAGMAPAFAGGERWGLRHIPPGEQIAVAQNDMLVEAPQEMSVSTDQVEWLPDDAAGDAGTLSVSDVDVSYGDDEMHVEFTATSSFSEELEQASVFALLRDSDGELLGGIGHTSDPTLVDVWPVSPGENAGEVSDDVGFVPPEAADEVEVYCVVSYALPGMD